MREALFHGNYRFYDEKVLGILSGKKEVVKAKKFRLKFLVKI